jgi:cell division protein ZapA
MPELQVTLCGQSTAIACSEEDEPRLRQLIQIVESRAENARAIVGDNDRWRQLMFAAIFLADELDSSAGGGGGVTALASETMDAGDAERVNALASRIATSLNRIETALDGALEQPRANA